MKLNRIAIAAAFIAGTSASLWMGTDASYDMFLDASERAERLEAQGAEAIKAKVAEFKLSNPHLKASNDDPFGLPPLWEVQGNVGVLHIDGPVITGSAGWMRLFGVLGYDDIKQAANELVSQKSVTKILMSVNSPGGSAAGTEETAAFLKEIGKQKPIMTHSATMMASAGYWMGSVGHPIMASSTAVLGSIGVIITHVSVQRANEAAGRDVTVLRIGEHKALANPNEKLSDAAKAHLIDMGEQIYAVFRSNVAANLGLDEKTFDKTVGLGREFMGQKAVDAGLAHQVATFDQALAYAKAVDTSKLNSQNPRNSKGPSMKLTLAAALVAQLCAGADPMKLTLNVPTANAEGVAPDGDGVMALQSQAIVLSAAMKEGRETAVKEALAPVQAQVTDLTAKLATANTELGALRTSSTALTAQVQTLEKDVEASEKVLRGSISAMSTMLKEADKSAELKGSALVAEHTRVETAFAAKFPGAKVSAVASADTPNKGGAAGTEVPLWAQMARDKQAA